MINLKAIRVNKENFIKYGFYYNIKYDKDNIIYSKTDIYEDYFTKKPIIDTLGHLGYTIGKKAPYNIISMEKHNHTQEAIFCCKKPIILCVALSQNNEKPKSEHVSAFILEKEDIVVLNRNVWHDACHGLSENIGYYYLATRGEIQAKWETLDGDEVLVTY